jgi:hypothetical protein
MRLYFFLVVPDKLSCFYNEPMFAWRVKFHRPWSGSWVARLLVIGCFLCSVAPLWAQNGSQLPTQQHPPSDQMPSGPVTPGDSPNPLEDRIVRQRIKALNEQRQKQLVEDTNRILALATELKEEVDKSTKDTLSLSVIKKAEQIEKLAKSVKDKMKAEQAP